jgi:hypothetical protein
MLALRKNRRKTYAIGASIVVLGAAMASVGSCDGRTFRNPITKLFSSRESSKFRIADSNEMYDEGWFKRELRCSKQYFDRIVGKIELKWNEVNKIPDPKCFFTIREKVGLTLYHLAHTTTYAQSGEIFGISKTRAISFVDEVLKVLLKCYEKESIRLPDSEGAWKEIQKGFEDLYGIPFVAGAIDGSLFEVQRYKENEGWYCRKGFPAFNIQMVVDHNLKFRSFSIRSGSHNDKSVFNKSAFRTKVLQHLPQGAFFLADAGYALSNLLMNPYKIEYGMPREQAKYNYFHSRARMTVERALGRLKGKWKRLSQTLVGKNPQNITKLIRGALILHNWLIDDDVNVVEVRNAEAVEEQEHEDISTPAHQLAKFKRDQTANHLPLLQLQDWNPNYDFLALILARHPSRIH